VCHALIPDVRECYTLPHGATLCGPHAPNTYTPPNILPPFFHLASPPTPRVSAPSMNTEEGKFFFFFSRFRRPFPLIRLNLVHPRHGALLPLDGIFVRRFQPGALLTKSFFSFVFILLPRLGFLQGCRRAFGCFFFQCLE